MSFAPTHTRWQPPAPMAVIESDFANESESLPRWRRRTRPPVKRRWWRRFA